MQPEVHISYNVKPSLYFPKLSADFSEHENTSVSRICVCAFGGGWVCESKGAEFNLRFIHFGALGSQ